jgi:tetratricopeptide (TPR) repeat protein
MVNDASSKFIRELEKKAGSITNDIDRSKKYRAGIAELAQKAVKTNNTTYLEAAVRFTEKIIDDHDRSKAYVDIVRGTARVAINTADADLAVRSLELSANTEQQHDRSHALQGVVAAMAEIGAKTDDPATVEDSKELAGTIEYDTYRSSAWRSIARTQHGNDNAQDALISANKAMEIIDVSKLISRDIYRASAYVDLARLFIDLGQEGMAQKCITKAVDSSAGLEDEFERSSIFQAIAETQVRMGARTKDTGLLEDAVVSFSNITREYYRTSTRQTLMSVLVNLKEDELVKKLA